MEVEEQLTIMSVFTNVEFTETLSNYTLTETAIRTEFHPFERSSDETHREKCNDVNFIVV